MKINFSNFNELCKYVKENDFNSIFKNALLNYLRIESTESKKYSLKDLQDIYNNEIYRDLPPEIEYFKNHIKDIKENIDKYEYVYNNLINERKSKEVFFLLLKAKLQLDITCINESNKDSKIHYFDKSIFNYNLSEIYVDCGGYTGDTAISFMKNCIRYKKIYIYEALPELIPICKENLKYFIDEGSLIVKENAVSNRKQTLSFSKNSGIGDSGIDESGEYNVNAVSLDEDISEKISFIKMDIEGSEIDAIIGAKNHILKDCPKMAICIYHKPDDFWKIPQLIYEINPNYKFLIRHHQENQFYDTVLYCVPEISNDIENTSHISDSVIISRYDALMDVMQLKTDEEIKDYYDLNMAKNWYLNEIRNMSSELEVIKSKVSDLNNSDFEIELNRYKEDNDKQKLIIKELSQWSRDLESAKEWHIQNLNNEKEANFNIIKDNEKLKNELSTCEDENKKLRFYLKEERNKPWYKKIIKDNSRTEL